MTQMKLYGEPGWGSALIEAQLDWYGFDYEFRRVGDLFESPEARQKLSLINPLAQIPTLVMTDETLMTESAAITLLLADLARNETLVPSADSPERAAFLRWLIFIVANVYPTYTYGDEPSRFVAGAEAQKSFLKTLTEYGQKMYRVLEDNADRPWFLGERFSALDIYICTMTRWQPPGRQWFAENTPKLYAIQTETETVAALQSTWQRNFPDD